MLWHRRAVLAAMAALSATPAVAVDRGARTAADPFALGIASGDPGLDGFVLWTRLVGPGAAPLQAGAIAVRCDIADDPGFVRIVRSLRGLARPEAAHAIHLEIAGLHSGDVHSFWLNDLNDTSGRTVGTENVTSAIGAASPPAGRFGDVAANNPHIRYSNVVDAGYVLLDIDAAEIQVDFRAIADRAIVASPVSSIRRFVIPSKRTVSATAGW